MSERDLGAQPVMVRDRRYEVIVLKEFKSTIPSHLLANLPDDEKFMVETMSKLENQYGWLADSSVRTSMAVVDVDERVLTLESKLRDAEVRLASMEKQSDLVNKLWDWKQFFTGKWAALAGVALVVVPLLSKFLLDVVMKWIKP